MAKIALITGNESKFKEAADILPGLVERVAIDLAEIQSVELEPVIRNKVELAVQEVKRPVLVEDVGLFCHGLNGLPGALVKWFLNHLKPEGLYQQVKASGDMSAEAICMVGFHDGHMASFYQGGVKGQIVAPRGEGFGWDPIFQPEGSERTFGEMELAAKQEHSMRAIALKNFRDAFAI